MNYFNPELQLENTKFVIENKLQSLLNELRGFKFVVVLVLKLEKKPQKTINFKRIIYMSFVHVWLYIKMLQGK